MLQCTFLLWSIPRLQLGGCWGTFSPLSYQGCGLPSKPGSAPGCDLTLIPPLELLVSFSSTTPIFKHLCSANELVIFLEVNLLSQRSRDAVTAEALPSSHHPPYQSLLLVTAHQHLQAAALKEFCRTKTCSRHRGCSFRLAVRSFGGKSWCYHVFVLCSLLLSSSHW